MKLGFLGNTNNYPFMLARAVRDLGHDVTFIVNRPERLHRPEHRYDDISLPYPAWIHDVPIRARQVLLPDRECRAAERLLGRCDALVLNELGPAVASGLTTPRVTLFTGSDLEQLADWRAARSLVRLFFPNRRLSRWLAPAIYPLVWKQRKGIRRSSVVAYFPRGLQENGDRVLDELGIDDRRRISFLMADVDTIKARPMPNNDRLRIFCVARLTWKRPTPGAVDVDFKGTDVLVRGVARFHRETGSNPELHLVRKGLHISETEELVRNEGIGHLVVWRDEMTQRQVLDEYAAADIVVDQLSSSFIGMGGMEAMATGRPLLADGRPEVFEPLHGPSPVCQARTVEDVARQLARLSDPTVREKIGIESRAHVERFFSPRSAAQTVMSHLEKAVGRTR